MEKIIKEIVVKNEVKLSIPKSPFSQEQILQILQKTPKSHIHTRPAKGGGNWDYVSGTYVKKILNYTFGWKWDFEVIEHGQEGNQVWILGKLICYCEDGSKITKMQFGRADIKKMKTTREPLDFGNDLKSATTDALKRCAAELGIASDIYGKEEFKEVQTEVKDVKKVVEVKDALKVAQQKLNTAKKICPLKKYPARIMAGK